MFQRFLALVVMFSVLGCVSKSNEVRTRAAFDLSCQRQGVERAGVGVAAGARTSRQADAAPPCGLLRVASVGGFSYPCSRREDQSCIPKKP